MGEAKIRFLNYYRQISQNQNNYKVEIRQCALIILFEQMSGIPNLKYKTSICNSWKEGLPCEKGFFCFFAHGEEELRTMEQNRQYLAQQNMLMHPQSTCKYKTTYCKFYAKGDCKLGQSCTFAHNKLEKRQKNYIPKQEMMAEQNFYYYPQYYPIFSNQFGNQMQLTYQYNQNYAQGWNQGLIANEQKSQENLQKTSERQLKSQDSKEKVQTPNSRPVQEFRQQ